MPADMDPVMRSLFCILSPNMVFLHVVRNSDVLLVLIGAYQIVSHLVSGHLLGA